MQVEADCFSPPFLYLKVVFFTTGAKYLFTVEIVVGRCKQYFKEYSLDLLYMKIAQKQLRKFP